MSNQTMTFPLDPATLPSDACVVDTVVLVILDEDGAVSLKEVNYSDTLSVEDHETRIEAFGGQVLARINGEADLCMGSASVWVRR